MMCPLPTVEMACSVIQQEESQRENVKNELGHEIAAMYTKTTSAHTHNTDKCSECGGKGHSKDNCWQLIGYPKWHSKERKFPQTGNSSNNTGKWQSHRSAAGRSVNSAIVQEGAEDTGQVVLSAKQFDQLLKMLPSIGVQEDKADLDSPFSGMAISGDIKISNGSWIMDSGATDHMTSDLTMLSMYLQLLSISL